MDFSALTKSLVSQFISTLQAEKAFLDLKRHFTSAPILSNPDPSLPFIVEVDPSDSGIGAILSQQAAKDNKLHPCAFFSLQLIAVKPVLEEWRHWLENSEHPFLVWTDHKNLSYIQDATCFNSCQAR